MYLLASSYTAQGMFAAGMLILTIMLLRRLRRYQRRNKQQARRPSGGKRRKLEEARAATPLLDAPPELLRWQVDMHETARDLKAELDSKMGALQAIIRIANEASTRLQAVITRAEQLGISPCAETLAAIEELSSGNDLVAATLPAPPSVAGGVDAMAQRATVYQLADQGLAASAIAQSIGAPLGEVELMMSLRSQSM